MNFDFGEVLSQAWQIIWKHKVLWAISLLPLLILFLFLTVWPILVFQKNFDPDHLSRWIEDPVTIGFIVIIYLVIIAASMFLQITSRASVTLGIYRAAAIIQPITFVDLLTNGFQYFWRILGISFLIGVGITAVFFGFFTVLAALSVLTLGFAALCIQPFFILIIPFIWLVMTFMEQAESAVIADGMNAKDALRQSYELIKSNIWKYLLITIIIYVGMGVLTSLVVFPLMIPMFFLIMRNLDAGTEFNNVLQIQAVFGLVILPVIAVVQGFSLTYMKSAMMLVYLRLTRSAQSQPMFQEATI